MDPIQTPLLGSFLKSCLVADDFALTGFFEEVVFGRKFKLFRQK